MMQDSQPAAKSSPLLRSKLANGSKLLPMTDVRSATARRFKDLIEDISADLGGADLLSEAEKQLIRRGALLSAESERQEAIWARQYADDGKHRPPSHALTVREPDAKGEKFDLLLYSTMVNCQRRIFETLGIKRRPRDVMTLDQYVDAHPVADDSDEPPEPDAPEPGAKAGYFKNGTPYVRKASE